jgi:hypothetical protein
MQRAFLLALVVVCVAAIQQPLPISFERVGVAANVFSFPQGNYLDVNGDGLPDYIVSFVNPTNPPDSLNLIWMNDGKGNWIPGGQWHSVEESALTSLRESLTQGLLKDEEYMQLVELLASGDPAMLFFAKQFQHDKDLFMKHTQYHLVQKTKRQTATNSQ